MAKLIFNDEISHNISSKYHIRNSKYPFSSWIMKPINLNNKQYYLYIEQSTNFAIVGRFLDKHKFKETLYYTLSSLPFITSPQVDKILAILSNLNYSYEKTTNNSLVKKYQEILNSIPNDQVAKLKQLHGDNQILEATLLSEYLNQIAEVEEIPITTKFALKVNEELPVLSSKPKASVKYVNLKANYTDPRSWEKFENLSPTSVPALELQNNNLKIINQFEHSHFFKQSYKDYKVFSALEAFLNTYLFKYGVRPVTKNLADPINFIELNTLKNDEISPVILLALHDLFLSFYEFLSHTGTIRKADAEKVKRLLNEKYASTSKDFYTNLHQLYNTVADTSFDINSHKMKSKIQTSNTHADETYEIRVKLKDFKPTTWRSFIISSATSLAALQQIIITMFNGLLIGHMYTLYDNGTKQFYDLPEFQSEDLGYSINATKVKLSEFGLNQKFTVIYDFGDNWEFEATIKKILNEKPPKHPTILAGKRFGILEDIGGTERLSDYYKGLFSQEEKEWVGDIDLDKFDIDEMNEQLREFE